VRYAPANQVGLTVSQEVLGNTFVAQCFNGNKNNGKAAVGSNPAPNAQSKFGFAFGWYGNMLDGMIKPLVAYTMVPEAAGSASTAGSTSRVNKGIDNYIGAGLQFNLLTGLTIEADYNLLAETNAGGSTSVKKDLKTTSIVGLIRYTTERFSPFVKVISDTSKTDSVKTGSVFAYDIGLEFKEAKDDKVRYHVVYSGSTVKTGLDTTSSVKSTPSSILAGVKFDASIL
jgi:hypothetical protein